MQGQFKRESKTGEGGRSGVGGPDMEEGRDGSRIRLVIEVGWGAEGGRVE